MRKAKGLVRLMALLLTAALILSACKAEPQVIEREVTREVVKETTREVVKEVTKQVTKEVTRVVPQEVTVVVPATPVAAIPFATTWVSSGHADVKADAFNHWNEDQPPVVPKACAKCHSEYGYLDLLGVDGTAAGTVDNDAKVGSVITCVTCHNPATEAMTSVILPSGVEVKGLGPEARCMQCHQGRASTATVDQAIAKAVQCTPKQLQKRWTQMLELAWAIRNGNVEVKS